MRQFDIKVALYCALFGMGVLLMSVGYGWCRAFVAEGVVAAVPGFIALAVGAGCTLFGFATYMLKDEPDIWV